MHRLKLIQCGVGGFGTGWAKQHVPGNTDFELAAIVDVSEKALAEIGDALNVPTCLRFSSLGEALEDVKADAALTVTPPAVHAEHAELAFSRGLHLLTEKPIADTLENAQRMVQWAQKAGKQLVVSQNYRFRAAAVALRQLVEEKPVGTLGHGHLDFYIAADFGGGFRGSMQFPLLVDMAIHHFDLIRAITGRNIVSVTALTFNPPGSWYKHDAGLKMLLELEGGMPFSYSGDWTARGRFTGWEGSWRLQCSEGDIGWSDGKITVGRSSTWCKDLTVEEIGVRPVELSEQAYVLYSFAEAIRTGKPAPTSGADNLFSFAAVMAGVQSAIQKRSVSVSELLGAGLTGGE